MLGLIFHIFFIGSLQFVKYTDRTDVLLSHHSMPIHFTPTEIMLYAANTRIFWPIKDLYKDFHKANRIPAQSGLIKRLFVWAAIVIPVCLSGSIQALKLGELNRPAAGPQVDRPELHETYVPNPNQPPVFTRGFGTR